MSTGGVKRANRSLTSARDARRCSNEYGSALSEAVMRGLVSLGMKYGAVVDWDCRGEVWWGADELSWTSA